MRLQQKSCDFIIFNKSREKRYILWSELHTPQRRPTFEAVILWYSDPIFICCSVQKNVDFLANLSYHTTNLGAPQKRRTPSCISPLQQGGFHTTGILQTNRNTWIQGTRKAFKSSESYTISRKITTYHIVAQQFGALGAENPKFESLHYDQPRRKNIFGGVLFKKPWANFQVAPSYVQTLFSNVS